MLWGVDYRYVVLALAVAAAVTAIELMTSKYPRTARFVLCGSVWFYVYVAIYGLIAAIVLILAPWLGDALTISGIGASNPVARAVLIGFSVKALLHIRIFAVSTGPGQSFPVGLESFVQLFEPWMLRSIELDHFFTQGNFIAPRAAKFTDVAVARSTAKAKAPPGLTPAEKAVFEADIDQSGSPTEVIAAYLKYSGIRLTQATFP